MTEEIKTEEERIQESVKRIKKKIEQMQEERKNIKDIKEYMNEVSLLPISCFVEGETEKFFRLINISDIQYVCQYKDNLKYKIEDNLDEPNSKIEHLVYCIDCYKLPIINSECFLIITKDNKVHKTYFLNDEFIKDKNIEVKYFNNYYDNLQYKDYNSNIIEDLLFVKEN